MRIKNIKLFVLFVLLFFTSGSCSRFEDGPFISLLSAKNRISREWKVEYSINFNSGITHSADYEGWLLSFDKGGTFTNKIIYNQNELNYIGTWEITGGNQIRFDYNSETGEVTRFFTILRLTKKELWLKDDSEEIHYYSE